MHQASNERLVNNFLSFFFVMDKCTAGVSVCVVHQSFIILSKGWFRLLFANLMLLDLITFPFKN